MATTRGYQRDVHSAALAMADFDGHCGDYQDAVEWLDVAETIRPLPAAYMRKRSSWTHKLGASAREAAAG